MITKHLSDSSETSSNLPVRIATTPPNLMYTNWSIWGSLKAYATGLLPLILQAFPPRSHFAVEDIPDLTGKVVIVTGAFHSS